MRGKISLYFILILIASFFWKCSETKELDPDDLGANYFPLKTGTYRIYEVEGVIYNSIVDSTYFSYLLKESVVDSFVNLENGISYKIQREKKMNNQEPWLVDSIWTARKDTRTAVMVENNVPYVKLSFPVGEGITWDGNRLNSNYEDEYEMVDVGHSYQNSFGSFDKTVTVIQEDLADIIVNTISKKEIYGENVGLIYKENVILIFNQSIGIVNSGMRYYQQLVEYGEE